MSKGHLSPEKRLEQNFERLRTTNLRLRAKVAEQDKLIAEQQRTIETLKVQIAELQTMVFGKKRKPPMGHYVPELSKSVATPRNKQSYRRPLPPADAITGEERVLLPESCVCGGSFSHLTTYERYEEDIPLPELTENYQAHLVTKYVIEHGVCESCGKASAGGNRNLGGQAVTLGPNIRLLICHLVTVVGMSYAQVSQLCQSLYGIAVSDGEIANTLSAQHRTWLPAYERLKTDIRSSPSVHVDETSWPIQALNRQGYGWVMADSNNPSSYFILANSRGARHAQALLKGYTGIRITDDYAVYRSLPGGRQQLCWAHLYRAIRDLVYNENLPKDQLPYVSWWYGQFAAMYEDLRLYLAEPYDEVVRAAQSHELWQSVQRLCEANRGEPAKLTNLKAQLLRAGQDKLFVCLQANIPCDNNRGERDLRPLVLKRKRSFGSKTEQGAQALATVFSLCTTTWRRSPSRYFSLLAALG